ncbi:MAG: hypothetical protein HND44_02955 [Chloroflexi bacterium]|nr:hypothetical protein [Ardenticatenaceae bacterium]MBL1127457.1 hypothetical protein [Chloroflexota bacterium]NOG33521.1 hypothetical protein [Chloroflexota bacterium]GIK55785.1 MAG: hypothetical protein BroJett015_14480 [Chloroflexota bacterium]
MTKEFVAGYTVGGNKTDLAIAYGLAPQGKEVRIYWTDGAIIVIPIQIRSKERQPEVIVNELITELGGLPKTDLNIYEVRNSVTSVAAVYPVKDWNVELSRAARTPHLALFDDDPTYNQDFIIHVMFVDGDTAVLHWSSWSYGIVACPVVISLGSGPPGVLQAIHRP